QDTLSRAARSTRAEIAPSSLNPRCIPMQIFETGGNESTRRHSESSTVSPSVRASVFDMGDGSEGGFLSMVDHFESVSHRLAREADDPLERAAQVQGHLDCRCSCKRAKKQHHSDGRVTGCEQAETHEKNA